MQELIKFNPNVTFGEDGLDFDLGLTVDLPDMEVSFLVVLSLLDDTPPKHTHAHTERRDSSQLHDRVHTRTAAIISMLSHAVGPVPYLECFCSNACLGSGHGDFRHRQAAVRPGAADVQDGDGHQGQGGGPHAPD